MGACATLQNSRGDKCPSIMSIAKRLILVPELDHAGAKNDFDLVGDVTKSALQTKFDHAEKLARYYPISILENVEDVRSDAEFFEFNSGRKSKVKDGIRTFVGFIPFQGSEYMGKLEDWACNKFGVYIIDKDDNFVYSTDDATKLKVQPIMVDENSFSAELVKKTDSEPIMIKITFDFRETEKDALLRAIDSDDLDFSGLSSVDVYGLYDAKHVVGSATATGWVSTVTENIYGFKIEGLLLADWSLKDSSGSAVSITTADETADGVYTFVIPSTPADVLTLSLNKAGYDDSLIQSVTITTP